MRLVGDRVVFPDGPEGPPLRSPLGGGPEGSPAESAEGGPGPVRRQDKPPLYARNGPAVVVVRTKVLLEDRVLYGPDTRALVMSREDSLDIDDLFDLELAELLLAARTGRSLT
jgi:hypothetical protein